MADIAKRLAEEVDELVTVSEKLAPDAAQAGSHLGPDRVAELSSIASRAGQLIRRLYGESSQYQANLDRVLTTRNLASMHSNWCTHVAELAGIVQGIQRDLQTGMLDDLRGLLQAEVFADFLEMAEHLLDGGYKDPAAVLLGAVLVDTLRKISAAHSVHITAANGRPMTIDPINTALAKAGAYGALVQKQITSWANLRNDAAHGHFAKYDVDQVRQMLLFTQKFCADYLK